MNEGMDKDINNTGIPSQSEDDYEESLSNHAGSSRTGSTENQECAEKTSAVDEDFRRYKQHQIAAFLRDQDELNKRFNNGGCLNKDTTFVENGDESDESLTETAQQLDQYSALHRSRPNTSIGSRPNTSIGFSKDESSYAEDPQTSRSSRKHDNRSQKRLRMSDLSMRVLNKSLCNGVSEISVLRSNNARYIERPNTSREKSNVCNDVEFNAGTDGIKISNRIYHHDMFSRHNEIHLNTNAINNPSHLQHNPNHTSTCVSLKLPMKLKPLNFGVPKTKPITLSKSSNISLVNHKPRINKQLPLNLTLESEGKERSLKLPHVGVSTVK